MTQRKDSSPIVGDIEIPHPTVARLYRRQVGERRGLARFRLSALPLP